MIIQLKHKLNDFRIGSTQSRTKPSPSNAVFGQLLSTSGKFGTYLTRGIRDGSICGYHAEKTRAKFKQEIYVTGRGASKKFVKKSTKVREAGWKLRVFAFPQDQVVYFKQFARHFEVVLK
jgi:hypothetical protein